MVKFLRGKDHKEIEPILLGIRARYEALVILIESPRSLI